MMKEIFSLRLSALFFLFSSLRPVFSQDDLVSFYAVPAYSSADSCVQGVIASEHGANLVRQGCGYGAPYSCFCRNTAHSSTRIYQLSLAASQSCSGENSGNTAMYAFQQYCSFNANGIPSSIVKAEASPTGTRALHIF